METVNLEENQNETSYLVINEPEIESSDFDEPNSVGIDENKSVDKHEKEKFATEILQKQDELFDQSKKETQISVKAIEPLKDKYDVVIIGAGISGLYSAYYLFKKCKNLKILVIEGKDRVGGRTQTVEIKCSEDGQKSKWDLGGQWVTDTQTHVTKLLKELNIETYQQFVDGKKILETNGKIVSYNSSIPSVSILSLIDIQMGSMKISTNAKKISTINPFDNLELAARLDSGNFDEFLLSKSFSSKSRSLLDPAIRTIYGAEASQLNALFGLMYIKSGGGTLESLALSDKGCAQEKKIIGGAQQISEKLSKLINENGGTILLNSALTEIKQNGESSVQVFIKSLNEEVHKFECKKVISSIPINQYVHIDFQPELPSYKRNVFQYCQMGNLIKFIVTYKIPFWRQKGFSGEVVSDGSVLWLNSSKISDQNESYNLPKSGPIACIFDGSNEKDDPALVGFIGAKMAVDWLDQKEELRKQEVIEALVRYFGEESRDYLEYVEKLWAREKYSGGCPTCNVSSSGVMEDYARAVREPFLNLHFCGTESATVWQGYMDGAIQSGERAANEVLFSLFRDDISIEYDYENTYFYQNEISKTKSKQK